jgi:hypothetical protein
MPVTIRDADDDQLDEEAPLQGEPVEINADIAPGPDERDMDLMDGSWEERHYAGKNRSLDWHAINIGLGIAVVVGIVVPSLLVFFR